MGNFTTLEAAEIQTILQAYGLSGYRKHHPIAAGTINTNIRVELADRPVFLRVNEGKPLGEVQREAAILEHIVARGVRTPLPLRTRDGLLYASWGSVFVSVFPWVDGQTLSRDDVTPAHAAAVGVALARLHQAGADISDRRPGRYESDEIDRRVAHISAVDDPVLKQALQTLIPELANLHEARTSQLETGLIHGDLFIDNVLFAEDGQPTLIDFEQASWGGLAYDIAVTLLAFAYGRADFRAAQTRALLDGYRSVRVPTAAEQAGFAAELRFAACRFAVTRITDVYLRATPGGEPGGKDFHRYLDRLHAVRKHCAAQDGLLDL